MALEAFIGFNGKEKFNRNRDDLDDIIKTIEEDNNNAIGLTLPRISLNLKTMPNPSNPSKCIADEFKKGTTTLAFVYRGGVVVCADSRATGGQYVSSQRVRKIIEINQFLLGTMAGGAADCSYWERILSKECRLFELRNKSRISVAAASKILSNILYSYKGMGLSLGVMICGWDKVRGPQIFYVDNDGNRQEGKLFSVGSGSTYAYGVLDSYYDFNMNDQSAHELGQRAIFHATHRDAMSGGIVRVYTIKEDGWKIISEKDMADLYDQFNMPRP